MFLSRYLPKRSNLWRTLIGSDSNIIKISSLRNYTGTSCNSQQLQTCSCNRIVRKANLLTKTSNFLLESRRYSKLIDGDITQLQKNQHERDLKKITDLFPQPRVTLNELTSKTPQKIFDIHYKQQMIANRKKMAQGDWTCTYAFLWPEKMKFESTSISKRQAAEKAATQALLWLYKNKHIDSNGSPIYDETVLNELRDTINQPIQITISDKSMERIDRIWKDYETGIKPFYEAVFEEAESKPLQTPVLSRDSTIDTDEFSDDEIDAGVLSESSDKSHIHPVYGRPVKPPSESALVRRNKTLEQRFRLYDEELTPLPIDAYAQEITTTLESSRVLILVGAAGCGKSSRAPAAVLRGRGARVAAIVSEPRRVAAQGLAGRVADEMGEEVGETVGYQVRLHSKPPRPPGGSILYCTSGVLLRRLHNNPGLVGCTHVIIDEAHERDVNTDITLLLLKRALNINPELKVLIMSATLDTDVFMRYFDSCPIIKVPGRTFPVEIFHLEEIQRKFGLSLRSIEENCKKEDSKPIVNCQEVVEVIQAVDRTQAEGAILVFLPGWAEIKTTKQLLDEQYGESATHIVLPVHSRLSTADQSKMFSKPLPGVRKIVLSTNIAETSITIPDVVYVIDSGAHKENRLREGTGTASLETVWVSMAAANQRTGRAGRVQPGHCFRLYTKEKEAQFVPHSTPEILRIPLEQTVLDCKTYAPGDKVEDFLSQLPEPPSKESIQFAVQNLIDLGALTPTEELTRLGTILSKLSLHPSMAAAALRSVVLGAAPALARIAAICDSNTEMFRDSATRRDEIRELKSSYSKTSDHMALNLIQCEFEDVIREQGAAAADSWCDRRGLRRDRLQYVKSLSNLHLEQLLKSGFIEPNPSVEDLSRFSDVSELVAASLLGGADALLAGRRRLRTKGQLGTAAELLNSKGERAHIASESVNYNIAKRDKQPLLAYTGGQHSAERRALVLYKTSLVPPHTAVVFCGGDVQCDTKKDDSEKSILTLMRHNLEVHIPTSQASTLLKAREMWRQTFRYRVERDMQTIDYDRHVDANRFAIRLTKAIGKMLIEAHREYVLGNKVDAKR